MKLYYRMFWYFIVVSVIVLIFFFFIFEFVVSDRVMSVYLCYIVQKVDFFFFYDKYQNQSIVVYVMCVFVVEQLEVLLEQWCVICEVFEFVNNIYGLNLIVYKYLGLCGIL